MLVWWALAAASPPCGQVSADAVLAQMVAVEEAIRVQSPDAPDTADPYAPPHVTATTWGVLVDGNQVLLQRRVRF